MRSVLERMARAGHVPMYRLAPQQARAAYEAGAGVLETPRPQLARVQDLALPVTDGAILAARLYAPSAQRLSGKAPASRKLLTLPPRTSSITR